MMHLGDKDDEFCSVDRFDSIEPKIELIRFYSKFV